MVLKMLAAAYNYWPTQYTPHAVVSIILVLATHRIAQGRATTRERDLHGCVVLLTGAFTPLGLTLLEALAQRGAYVIALTADKVEERVATYVDLNVFAEGCDLRDPASVKAFGADDSYEFSAFSASPASFGSAPAATGEKSLRRRSRRSLPKRPVPSAPPSSHATSSAYSSYSGPLAFRRQDFGPSSRIISSLFL
ncbi:hypothetical protein MSAN_00825100 [Mycena sanguinolenta]|uniref:Ketoreductase (KR) domain-containing protein n=1 Tax=Mycena sanguinolenta TaxID=230812 RepID=A0A8H7DDJ4_9AGAR|nr:hypothetical protein MSAN_00825100 [Mycena sanguinolenta]